VTAERFLSHVVAVVLAFVVSPVIGLFSAIAWFEAGGKDSGGIAGFVVGIAVFTLLVWKSGTLFERVFEPARARLSEPISSCLLFGVVGALLLGGIMLTGILLLGHTRPMGWDFDRIPLLMGLGFMVFAVAGFVVGLRRRRTTHDVGDASGPRPAGL
jgi:hypothetical protein